MYPAHQLNGSSLHNDADADTETKEMMILSSPEDRVDLILQTLARLEERVSHIMQGVERAASREEVSELRRRLESIEADRSKIVWLMLAAVLTAVLSLVVQVRP